MTVRVDVGGYSLAAEVTAGGDPPTLFISGRGDGRGAWARVLPLLRGGTATITYDRAGIGDSAAVPLRSPRLYSALAGELATMLGALPISGPYVVVAHSMGAVIARSLAARHPALVAGLVLVDGSVDGVALWPGTTTRDGTSPAATLLDYEGGAAELATAHYPDIPAAVIARTPGRWSDAQATDTVDQRWTRHQQRVAEQLDAILLIANDSGHYVHHEAATLVAVAVDAVTNAVVRGDGLVKLDHALAVAAGGRLVREAVANAPRPGR